MPTPIGFCVVCKHRIKGKKCKAFPKGILSDILTGKFDHTQKHPDQDNDIVFEPIKEK